MAREEKRLEAIEASQSFAPRPASPVSIRVRFFGPARDLAGCEECWLTLPPDAVVATAVERLAEQFPALRDRLPHYRIAVNTEYANLDTVLREGDEVAIIPPVSGGIASTPASRTVSTEDTFVQLTTDEVDLTPLLAFVASPAAGAVVTFLGTVREVSHGKRVCALTYEAYEAMAVKELQRIADELRQRWQVCKVAIVHRLGTLKVGEVSVAIVVSAPHRVEAFAAAQHAIERIKEIVPIWKRELFADGTSAWVGEVTFSKGAQP